MLDEKESLGDVNEAEKETAEEVGGAEIRRKQ